MTTAEHIAGDGDGRPFASPGHQAAQRDGPRKTPRLGAWQPHYSPVALIATFLALAGFTCVILTYATMSGLTPFGMSRRVLLTLTAINAAIILAVAPIAIWRVARLVIARQNRSTSKLHVRMVILFSLITLIPAGTVAVFSGVTSSLTLNALVGDPVPAAIGNSATMARYFMVEQATSILGPELQAMANDVSNSKTLFDQSPIRFSKFLDFQRSARGLSSAYVINGQGTALARSVDEGAPAYTVPRSNIMEQAAQGRVTVFSDVTNSQFRGILKLNTFDDAYLVVSRAIDAQVLGHLAQTQSLIAQFDAIESNRTFIELLFILAFIVVTMIMLLGAIWFGLRAANSLVAPIDRLAAAAQRVSAGDLGARIDVSAPDDEIGHLIQTFNRMTAELQAQQNELVNANEQLDQRRRFTEAVLAGVSAGVVGLNGDGRVTIVNRSAETLMAQSRADVLGKPIRQVIPEVFELVETARHGENQRVHKTLDLTIEDKTRHFNVQVTGHEWHPGEQGFVITFDDITSLVSAQRTAAWADVARRIAHEIKNPLTPIQLSAERLKRKYGREIQTDQSVFEQCTDTIIRQVKDIGRMVDEFSSFARMPAPVMRQENMVDLVKQAVFGQRVANPDIDYRLAVPEAAVIADCDGRLIGQALTNILKNAAEGIATKKESLEANGPDQDIDGHIDVALEVQGRALAITIRDNGCGLPQDQREKLTEPYITTRAKGTGLGLAIVKKVMEDHRGRLILADAPGPGTGASVTLRWPLSAEQGRPHATRSASRKTQKLGNGESAAVRRAAS